METREFKRATHLTLKPKLTKAGIAGATKKRRDINVTGEVLSLQSASNRLLHGMEAFITPGIQLNDVMVARAKENLGEVLQHAITIAKLFKVKTPASQKKIKARTQTLLLMETVIACGEVYETFLSGVRGATTVPMTDEEKAVAQAKYAESEKKRREKFDALPATSKVKVKNEKGEEMEVDQPKGEYKPGKEPEYTKIQTAPLNEAAVKGQIEHLLKVAYEFNWSLLGAPVADTMAARIERIKPQYPEGFFTPPPKKPAPAGLKPGQKREKKTTDAAAVVATQETTAPVAEAAKA